MSTTGSDSSLHASRRATTASSVFDRDYLTLKPLITWIRTSAVRHARGTLVDWGCGNKPYAPLFEGVVDRYIGVDIAQNAVESVDVIIPEGGDLPFHDRSIDTLLSTQVLEHVPEPDRYIHEAARVLRDGGTLLLTCPASYMLHEEPKDFYRYTRYGLEYLLGKHGLSIITLETCGGAWRLIGQILLNHTTFGVRRRIPILSGGIHRVRILFVNIVCAVADRFNTNPKDTANYMVIARKGPSGT